MQTEEQEGFNPNKLNESDPSVVRFPEKFSLEDQESSNEVKLSELERSVTGYYDLEAEYREIERTLKNDILDELSNLSEEQLNDHVAQKLNNINESRQSQGQEPVDITGVNRDFKIRLLLPNWQDFINQDSDSWQGFMATISPTNQPLLLELREIHQKLAILSGDEALMKEVREARAEQITIRRAVAGYMAGIKRAQLSIDQVEQIYTNASKTGRQLIASERRRIDKLEKSRDDSRSSSKNYLAEHPELIEQITSEIKARFLLSDKHQLEKGLLLTENVQGKIKELLIASISGKPVLMVGETGGAKTAIAEYMCRHILHKVPEFVSGFGDVNAYMLMGKPTLAAEDGSTVSSFTPGPVVRAMEAGVPLILDEINAMPAEILKRLNKIMQLKAGDKFIVQEDSGREVTVKHGFCIIATANEKSKRYKGVEDLSTEFANRFGANIVRVHYPDRDVAIGQVPNDLTRLATAYMIDSTGKELTGITKYDLEKFVLVAHISQQLFTANYGTQQASLINYISTEAVVDQRPGLEETVIAPRTMIDILEKVKSADGRLEFEQILKTYLEGIKNEEDRKVIARLLIAHGLIKE